jgi:N6-adenosine-specific RNA methylase IME4
MSIDAIAALPVGSIAADDAALFLWATREVFREGHAARVARSWGFEPCGEVIWGLRNPGMGSGALVNDHEPVLVATRGRLSLAPVMRGLGVVFWRQPYAKGTGGKIHSAKPEGFLDLVEELAPEPRIELFARRQRLGWDTWGVIAGLDISTRAIHIVSLPEDTNHAQLHVVRVDTTRGDPIERIRRLRDRMPARSAWADSGCTLIAIEKPFHRGPGIALMMAVYGALLQLLPADLPLLELRSDDWRRECGIPIRKPREAPDNWHKRRALEFAREQWRDAPPFDHDGAEAFCVAWAAREIDLRAVRAA